MGRRFRRILGAAAVLIVLSVAVPVAGIELGCRGGGDVPPGLAAAGGLPLVDEPGYARPQSRTYFTFPEWYIVYAAEDLAAYTADRNESGFGYASSIAGFWRSVCTIRSRTRGWAEPTADVSVMIYVIGLSFTAEYAVKGLYETTIGRLTEWLRGAAPTAEDAFAHQVAADYARFLYTLPWYQYPFGRRFRELWSDVPGSGPSLVRKVERRIALSLEYGVKAVYGGSMAAALDASGGVDQRDIMMVVADLSPDDVAAEPRIAQLRRLPSGETLVRVPRYQAFTEIAVTLARRGRVIREVAGNRRILLTALLQDGAAAPQNLAEMVSMPLDARPGWRRAGFDVALADLPRIVPDLERRGLAVEHLFDY